MLIVEGPDGAGKTTLIRMLSEELALPIAPRVVSKETEAMVDLQKWVDDDLDGGFKELIYDRHRLISETVYGPILRPDKPSPGFDDLHWLGPRMKRFYDLTPIIIYCLPPYDTVEDNVLNDVDNHAVRFDISSIYTSYVAKASFDHALSPCTVKIWDYTTSPTIGGKPIWLHSVGRQLKGRTRA